MFFVTGIIKKLVKVKYKLVKIVVSEGHKQQVFKLLPKVNRIIK